MPDVTPFPVQRAIGVISGTSMDAIDVALIETDGKSHVRPLGGAAYPYPDALRARLRAIIASPEEAEHGALRDVETEVNEAFANAIRAFLAMLEPGSAAVDVIGFHGQTIFHRPERRLTRQLGDGRALARMLGIPVVNRFRHADVAAGGQGAPLVPLYHAALAAALPQPLMVLNLGGVANVTYLDGATILAFDTGPASALIDDAMQRHFGRNFDENGLVAARGHVDSTRLAMLLDNPFFLTRPPKSLDRNDFHQRARILGALSPEDEIATLTAFSVAATACALAHVPRPPLRWLVTGGGRNNAAMMRGLADVLEVPVEPVEVTGWNGDLLEAECFAYLAVRSRLGLSLSLPGTTGVPTPLTGGEYWTPQP